MPAKCLIGMRMAGQVGWRSPRLSVISTRILQDEAKRFSTSPFFALRQKQRSLRSGHQHVRSDAGSEAHASDFSQAQEWEQPREEVASTEPQPQESQTSVSDSSSSLDSSTPSSITKSRTHEPELEETAQEVTFRHIPRPLLEHWQDIPAPESRQRAFANNFFQRNKPKLLFTAGSLHQVDMTDVPEVAFLGRSNVGKSTLLNALLDDKVARVSAKPGKTMTLNAWAAGGPDRTGKRWRLTVLDMPGYGGGSRQEWGTLIQKYLAQRKELRRAFVLIHAEHGLLENDKVILQMLRQASIPHQIVLSKVDKLFDKSGPKMKLSKKKARSDQGISPTKLSAFATRVSKLVESIRDEGKGDRSQRELPMVPDMIAVAGDGAQYLPTQASECRTTSGAMGIGALRWAILQSVGITGDLKFKDEKDMTF